MIKPIELIDRITLDTDLRYAIREGLGRGGFEFYLRASRDIVTGFQCKIEGRTCWVHLTGQFKVSGSIRVDMELWCRIVIAVDPTSEDVKDGYAYHCFYSEKSQDYKYTRDVEELVGGMLHAMRIAWLNEDYVSEKIYMEKGNGEAYDGITYLSTYTNLEMYDSKLWR